MKQLLIATTNPGKLNEIKYFLNDLPLELISLNEWRDTLQCASTIEEPEESGSTFEENTVIKAKYYFEKSGLPVIADDGGLEIDFFNGEPGVKSKRWIGGKVTSDRELIEYALLRMRGLSRAKRGARLHTVVALAINNSIIYTKEGMVRGLIAEKEGPYTPGYPYRALFYLPQFQKYYDPKILTKDEYESVGHRGKALMKLKEIIKEELL